jgi:hypothetical protein
MVFLYLYILKNPWAHLEKLPGSPEQKKSDACDMHVVTGTAYVPQWPCIFSGQAKTGFQAAGVMHMHDLKLSNKEFHSYTIPGRYLYSF